VAISSQVSSWSHAGLHLRPTDVGYVLSDVSNDERSASKVQRYALDVGYIRYIRCDTSDV